MAVGRDPNGRTWHFILDLPPGKDGKRRQMRRPGFANAKVAREHEKAARAQFGGAEPAGSPTANHSPPTGCTWPGCSPRCAACAAASLPVCADRRST